jgi:type IV pilus assembly protein PilQ
MKTSPPKKALFLILALTMLVSPPSMCQDAAVPAAAASVTDTASATGTVPPAPGKEGDTLVELDYKNAELATVLRTLSYTYGLNLVTMKTPTGNVTMTLKDVTLDQALDAILNSTGYMYQRKGDIIYIFEGQTAANIGMKTEAIHLKYMMAADAIKFLEKTVSGKGDLKALETTNSIVVTDFPEFLAKVNKVVSEIDTAPIQVIIEAKILDVKRQDLDSLGVKFTGTYSPVGENRGLFERSTMGTGTARESMTGAVNLGTAIGTTLTPILTAGGITFKNFQISAAQINALIENKNTDLLAAPSIATLNGSEAKIVIGERYPYKEETQTTTGTTETTKFIDIGTILTVIPYVSPDGHITMEVHPEVSSFASALADGSPRITTREATAKIRVSDGETIMIGGLITSSRTKTTDRIPILGSLPVVGYMFSSRNKDYEERELVIFLTPHIIPADSKAQREVRFAESKEVYINLEGVGEKAVTARMFNMANSLEGDEGTLSKYKNRKTRMSEAADLYRQIAEQFPHAKEAPYSLLRAAEIYYYDFKEYDNARHIAQDFLDRYPESQYMEKARSMILNCDKKDKWRDKKISRVRDWQKIQEERAVRGATPAPKRKETAVTGRGQPVASQGQKEYKPVFDFRKKPQPAAAQPVQKKEYKPMFDFRKKEVK